MSQEKQFCRNCGKRDEHILKAFWEPGLCIDCHRLPIIGIRYDVFTGERIEPKPVTKHDGKLPGGDTYEVYYDGMGKDAFVCIQGTHNLADHEAILEPKQALLLLDWLRQEETTLKQLVKEQAQ